MQPAAPFEQFYIRSIYCKTFFTEEDQKGALRTITFQSRFYGFTPAKFLRQILNSEYVGIGERRDFILQKEYVISLRLYRTQILAVK